MPPPLRAARRTGIAYRAMANEDLPFLAELYASTRREEVAATGWPAEAQAQFLAQQFDAQHRHYQAHYPDAEWLVVERGGEPIGRLYTEEWPSQFRIIDIALTPANRGQGIGAAILRDVLEMARGAGKRVSIHVEKFNPAMRLYLRLGFTPVEDKGVYDLLEWRSQDEAS
ncbi:MAG TPA: GNAT family N-acetyltransferase [Allosphingosinicella sp.]|nr:GNAT family N-acetyltransferase [Allosphingosinicella sp.]